MKTILTLAIALITFSSIAQQDSVYVINHVDEMSGETTLMVSRHLIIANEDRTKGFSISAYIDDNRNISSLMAVIVGMVSCNEKDELIILFENGERITKQSWNKFNCDGDSWYTLNSKQIQQLKTLPIARMRITNGRGFDSYTGVLDESQSRYFIQLFKSL